MANTRPMVALVAVERDAIRLYLHGRRRARQQVRAPRTTLEHVRRDGRYEFPPGTPVIRYDLAPGIDATMFRTFAPSIDTDLPDLMAVRADGVTGPYDNLGGLAAYVSPRAYAALARQAGIPTATIPVPTTRRNNGVRKPIPGQRHA